MWSSSVWKPVGCAAMKAKRLATFTKRTPLDAYLLLLTLRDSTWGLKPLALVGRMAELIALLLRPVILHL